MTSSDVSWPRFEETSDGLLVLAPAKVNLNLLVGPRRADGYHDLDSLVVKISLYDELLLSRPNNVTRASRPRVCGGVSPPRKPEDAGKMPAGREGETPSPRCDAIVLSCEGADCGEAEDNLVYRAGRLLQAHAREHGWATGDDDLGARIHLTKRTPPGKGLGGGSSDAAAALLGLCRLWGLDRAADAESHAATLSSLAARLGSDVPLFLTPGACRMTGRGDILQPLDVAPMAIVLFLSDLFCATPAVYRSFDEFYDEHSALAGQPLAARQLDAACLRQPPSRWRHLLVNDLLPPALRICPALGDLHARLQAHTDIPILMTGSGSALFALCDDDHEAAGLVGTLPADLRGQQGLSVLVARTNDSFEGVI
ncbi:MAG: hypothetical protein FWE88_02925 [Phycisphaerae bacterium]|nr:hypothetical protein [Phycisphaerae bacterium]